MTFIFLSVFQRFGCKGLWTNVQSSFPLLILTEFVTTTVPLLRFQVFVQDREDLSKYQEYGERMEFLLGDQMLEGVEGVRGK